jgi:hypothetical protein
MLMAFGAIVCAFTKIHLVSAVEASAPTGGASLVLTQPEAGRKAIKQITNALTEAPPLLDAPSGAASDNHGSR